MPGNRTQDRGRGGQRQTGQNSEPFIEIKDIWYDKQQGLIKPEALSQLAREKAQIIYSAASRQTNKISQLRKYYDTIFRLNQIAKNVNDSENSPQWIKIKAELHRELALIHYAKGRKLVCDNFVSMMETLITAIENKKDLQVVTDFLEAFMAYYKELNPR